MTNAHVRLRSTVSINEIDSTGLYTGLYTGHLLITSSIFATAPHLIPSSGIPPAERSMKRTRLQALHSFVIYLRACLSQIVSSTSSWLVRGGFIGEFLTAVEGVNRRCTELLAHRLLSLLVAVSRWLLCCRWLIKILKSVCPTARLKNSENFLAFTYRTQANIRTAIEWLWTYY